MSEEEELTPTDEVAGSDDDGSTIDDSDGRVAWHNV